MNLNRDRGQRSRDRVPVNLAAGCCARAAYSVRRPGSPCRRRYAVIPARFTAPENP